MDVNFLNFFYLSMNNDGNAYGVILLCTVDCLAGGVDLGGLWWMWAGEAENLSSK